MHYLAARLWSHRVRLAWVGLLVVIAASYATALPSVTSDSRLSTLVSLSIIHEHNVELDEYGTAIDQTQPYLSTRSGGHILSVYPYGGPLMAMPLIALADLRAGLSGPNLDDQARAGKISGGVEFWAAVIIAYASVLLMAVTLHRMRAPHLIALLLTAGWALAGPLASTGARGLWQHGPAGLAHVAATLGVVEVERRTAAAPDRSLVAPLLLAGFAAAYGPYIRATTGVADLLLIAACAWLVVRAHRPRSIIWLFVGAVAGATPYLLTRSVTVDGGYQSPTGLGALSIGNLPRGLLGVLVSPSRGVLIWCPFLVVAVIIVARRLDRSRLLPVCLGVGALSVLGFTAAWPGWWGGYSVGPRLMSEFTTLTVLFVGSMARGLVIHRSAIAVLAAVILLGAGLHWIGAHRTVMDQWNTSPNVDEHQSRLWSWSDSQLLAWFHFPREGAGSP